MLMTYAIKMQILGRILTHLQQYFLYLNLTIDAIIWQQKSKPSESQKIKHT